MVPGFMGIAPGHGAFWGNDMAVLNGMANTAIDPHRLDQYTESQQQGIRDAWNAYKNDPATLKKLMADTGVSAQTIGYAVGLDPYAVNSTINPVTYTPAAGYDGSPNRWTNVMESQGATMVPAGATGLKPTTVQAPGNGTAGGGMGLGTPGGGMGGSSGQSGSMSMTGQNPYLKQMGDVMVGQMTDAFRTQVLPGIGSQAMAAGGYGGSRQGVVEANAMNDLGRNIGNSLTNLYGQGYNTALNYDLGLRNNQLGYGNLGLGYANLDRNINNDNWANNMQGAQFGLNVWDRLMNNNQTGINAGTNIQNTPMNYWNQFSQGANSIGQGYGTQTSSGSTQGNPMLGAAGGAQLGSQIANWWSGSGNTSSMPNSNVFFGTGSMGD